MLGVFASRSTPGRRLMALEQRERRGGGIGAGRRWFTPLILNRWQLWNFLFTRMSRVMIFPVMIFPTLGS